jgi:hypothetical protein
MSKRNSMRTYTAGLAAVLVLTGCQAEAAPGPEPTNASSPAPSGSPTSSPTGSTSTGASTSSAVGPTSTGSALPTIAGLPEAAKHRTAEGANAFVRYYFERMNEIYQDPEEGVLTAFGRKGCKACAVNEDVVGKLLRNGDRFASDRVTSLSITGFGENLPTDKRYTVSAQMDQTGAKVVDSRTEETVHTDEVKSGWFAVHLTWVDGWRIHEMQTVDDGLGTG